MNEPEKATARPWRVERGDRLSDGSACLVIDSDECSIAEMMCPKDVERGNAGLIVTAINAHDSLLARIERLERDLTFCRDLAEEELTFAKVGTGAEVALRHIGRRARAALEEGECPIIDKL